MEATTQGALVVVVVSRVGDAADVAADRVKVRVSEIVVCLCREVEFLGPEIGLGASLWMFDALWLSLPPGCNPVADEDVEKGDKVEGKVVRIVGPVRPSFSTEACSGELSALNVGPITDSQWRQWRSTQRCSSLHKGHLCSKRQPSWLHPQDRL